MRPPKCDQHFGVFRFCRLGLIKLNDAPSVHLPKFGFINSIITKVEQKN